jgi:hypothetical protein
MKSKSSEMIRVINDLIPVVKNLNDLCRDGHGDEVLSGLGHLIATVERGESLSSYNGIDQKLAAILKKLDQSPAPIASVKVIGEGAKRSVMTNESL